MSTFQLSLDLQGSPNTLGSATATSSLGSIEKGGDSQSTAFPSLSDGTDLSDPQFAALIQALLVGGSGLPEGGPNLPLEAATQLQSLSAEQLTQLTRAIETAVAGATDGQATDQQLPLGFGDYLQQLPTGQALEQLSDRLPFLTQNNLTKSFRSTQVADATQPMLQETLGLTTSDRSANLPATARPIFSLAAPIGQDNWSDALGERIGLMVKGGLQVAHLRLDPPHLGPVELRVTVNQDQASVAFVAQHAQVRDALEHAIPRLREMLGEQALQLVDVNVSQGDVAGGRGENNSAGGSSGHVATYNTHSDGAEPEERLLHSLDRLKASRLVDLFA